MTDERRSLNLQIEVPGTPEQVWRAVATGPGISSWYVPHDVEERPGGAATASFGEGPELQIAGRVAAWEPPHRIVFDGGEGVDGLAFEWLVGGGGGGTCIVRLINSGFGSGAEWDAQYDGMAEGWHLFLLNLRLHLEHFAGRSATAMLPMASWPTDPSASWTALTQELSIPAAPQVGDHLVLNPNAVPTLAGQVVDVGERRLALLVDDPAPGTAFLAVEGHGEHAGVSIWAYLYGDDAASLIQRDRPLWQRWLDDHAVSGR